MMALTFAMDHKKEDESEANAMLAGGATIGALGIAGAVISGAVCPVCVVAAPVLLGIGIARKIRAARGRVANDASPLKDARDAPILPATRSS